MPELNDTHKSVLKLYSRSVVHIRKQVLLNRFGLVFGAGLSKGFGIPTWGELVNDLANDENVKGGGVLGIVPPRAALPYKTEMLFEHFKQRRYNDALPQEHHTRPLDYRIGADWREIVRKHLYEGVGDDLGRLLDGHPYL